MPSSAARALALLAALSLTGCASLQSSTQTVGPDRLDAAAAALAGGSGLLSLTDGTRYRVDALRIEPDTTSWIDPSTGDLRLVPTPFVSEFMARNRRKALLHGAGLGALVGAAAGATLGLAFCADLGCGDEAPTVVLFFGALAAPSGAFWGGALGAIADPVDRWTFERAARPPAAAPGPPDGR